MRNVDGRLLLIDYEDGQPPYNYTTTSKKYWRLGRTDYHHRLVYLLGNKQLQARAGIVDSNHPLTIGYQVVMIEKWIRLAERVTRAPLDSWLDKLSKELQGEPDYSAPPSSTAPIPFSLHRR